MNSLFHLVSRLLDLIHYFLLARQREKKDREIRSVNEDPEAWFNTHFDGGNDGVRDSTIDSASVEAGDKRRKMPP